MIICIIILVVIFLLIKFLYFISLGDNAKEALYKTFTDWYD